MPEKVSKPKEPTGTPEEEQVQDAQQEPTEAKKDSSEEVRSDEADEKFKNLESELGRLRQELGDERKKAEELSAYKLYYDQQRQQQQYQQQQQQQPTPEKMNELWFDNPSKMAQAQQQQMYFQSAWQQAPIAKSVAKMQNPGAFEGISDQELEQVMYGGAQSGTTNPGMLTDPNAWVGAAWIIKGRQTNYSIPTAPPQNLDPTKDESPRHAKPSDDEEIPSLRGDDLTETLISEIIRASGGDITREEAIKEIQATRDMEGR